MSQNKRYPFIFVHSATYLGPLGRVADLHGRRSVRSSITSCPVVSSFRLSTDDSRSFNVSAPRIWNALPEDVVSAPSSSTSWRRLKTFLFQQSHLDLVIWLYIWHHSGPWSDFSYLGHSKITELNWTEYAWGNELRWCLGNSDGISSDVRWNALFLVLQGGVAIWNQVWLMANDHYMRFVANFLSYMFLQKISKVW